MFMVQLLAFSFLSSMSSIFSVHPPILETPGFSKVAMVTSDIDFLRRWMMISAIRQKTEKSNPTSNIPRGNLICSILREMVI